MYYLKKDKDSAKKKTTKSKRQSLTVKLDKVFSEFIRLRDTNRNETFRCIACGRFLPYKQADCGHYHSRRHMSTRWDENNCHAECRSCNRFKADHMIGYERNLRAKLGDKGMNLLMWKAKQIKQYSDFELEILIKHYRQEVKKIRKEKDL